MKCTIQEIEAERMLSTQLEAANRIARRAQPIEVDIDWRS